MISDQFIHLIRWLEASHSLKAIRFKPYDLSQTLLAIHCKPEAVSQTIALDPVPTAACSLLSQTTEDRHLSAAISISQPSSDLAADDGIIPASHPK